jgi:hypothetical protein
MSLLKGQRHIYSCQDRRKEGPLLTTSESKGAASTGGTASCLLLLAEDVGHLHVHVEELCRAPVETDGLSLIQLAFAVVGWDALLRTGFV